MMSLQQNLKRIHQMHESLDCPAFHYWRPIKGEEHWCIWYEEGEADSFHSDDHKMEQNIQGRTHVYTHVEYDPVLDSVQDMLDELCVSWALNSVQFEEDTNTIHYEWIWEA